jgi:hypothetical protein
LVPSPPARERKRIDPLKAVRLARSDAPKRGGPLPATALRVYFGDLERLFGLWQPTTSRRAARACDGHHEMSDLAAAGELVHRGGEGTKPVWVHRRWMVRAGLREKIMSKTMRNSESRQVRETRELRDDELALVNGGTKGAVVHSGWNLAQNKKAA